MPYVMQSRATALLASINTLQLPDRGNRGNRGMRPSFFELQLEPLGQGQGQGQLEAMEVPGFSTCSPHAHQLLINTAGM
jgi:hypothetical protein